MMSQIKHERTRKRRYSRLLTFHIQPELDFRISQAADRGGITRSAFIRDAILTAIATTEAIDDCALNQKKPVR